MDCKDSGLSMSMSSVKMRGRNIRMKFKILDIIISYDAPHPYMTLVSCSTNTSCCMTI